MADSLKGRNGRADDSMVPLLTGLVVIAAVGPALFAAATQWLVPRLTAGGESVSVSLSSWWERNWWLASFWALELMALLLLLAWSRRRQRRRQRELRLVADGLAEVLPADWDPRRDLRVTRWRGARPIGVRLRLTRHSALTDPGWRQAVADTAIRELGPLAPIRWPTPPRGFDWADRPPFLDLRVARASRAASEDRRAEPAEGAGPTSPSSPPEDPKSASLTQEFVRSRTIEPLGPGGPVEQLPIYRRPASAGRSATEAGSTSAHRVRED